MDKPSERADEERTMLADIYGWFTEGFETADLKFAKSLLDGWNPSLGRISANTVVGAKYDSIAFG